MKHTYYERIAYGMERKRKKRRRSWMWGIFLIVAGVILWSL